MASQEISSKNKILSGIIGFGILFLIVEVVYYSWTIPFKYEAVNQKAYKEISLQVIVDLLILNLHMNIIWALNFTSLMK